MRDIPTVLDVCDANPEVAIGKARMEPDRELAWDKRHDECVPDYAIPYTSLGHFRCLGARCLSPPTASGSNSPA